METSTITLAEPAPMGLLQAMQCLTRAGVDLTISRTPTSKQATITVEEIREAVGAVIDVGAEIIVHRCCMREENWAAWQEFVLDARFVERSSGGGSGTCHPYTTTVWQHDNVSIRLFH